MSLAISLALITSIDLGNVTTLKWNYSLIFHVNLYTLFDPQQNIFRFYKKIIKTNTKTLPILS